MTPRVEHAQNPKSNTSLMQITPIGILAPTALMIIDPAYNAVNTEVSKLNGTLRHLYRFVSTNAALRHRDTAANANCSTRIPRPKVTKCLAGITFLIHLGDAIPRRRMEKYPGATCIALVFLRTNYIRAPRQNLHDR